MKKNARTQKRGKEASKRLWETLREQARKNGNFSFFILAVNALQSLIAIAALIVALLALAKA